MNTEAQEGATAPTPNPAEFLRRRPEAVLPTYAHGPDNDAGMDLTSVEEVRLLPLGRALVDTGWDIALPAGVEGQIRPRSGLANKHGITVLNTPGTVDPGYRGPLRVILVNLSPDAYTVMPGDRVAQIVFSRCVPLDAVEVAEMTSTKRGAAGFGSTGR